VPRRLRPTADIYEDAILVGDPGRAMALAQVLTEGPKMSNHARGLWGYSGRTGAGHGLNVQATGMGGPSAALVLSDLAELGVRRAVRVGTCAALAPGLRPGDLVTVAEACAWSTGGLDAGGPPADEEAGSRSTGWRGQGRPAKPDAALAERLRTELGDEARPGRVASLDVLHPSPAHPSPDGDVADMQTAALLGAGRDLGVALAAVLIVSEADDADALDDEALAERAAFAAEGATRALFALRAG
jgi:uridine phosphorylase